MRHVPARQLLAQLLDETLSDAVDREVREHLGGCRRCQRAFAELELCDRLVSRLPHAIAPLLDPAEEEQRLAGLASWTFLRRARAERWLAAEGTAAALVAAALAGVVAFAGTTSWVPPATASGTGDVVQAAYVMPATASR
jgi:anti-sigma factor RsiW